MKYGFIFRQHDGVRVPHKENLVFTTKFAGLSLFSLFFFFSHSSVKTSFSPREITLALIKVKDHLRFNG